MVRIRLSQRGRAVSAVFAFSVYRPFFADFSHHPEDCAGYGIGWLIVFMFLIAVSTLLDLSDLGDNDVYIVIFVLPIDAAVVFLL
jgi:hypothetical protein